MECDMASVCVCYLRLLITHWHNQKPILAKRTQNAGVFGRLAGRIDFVLVVAWLLAALIEPHRSHAKNTLNRMIGRGD